MRWMLIGVIVAVVAAAAVLGRAYFTRGSDHEREVARFPSDSMNLSTDLVGDFYPPDCSQLPTVMPMDPSLIQNQFDGIAVGIPAEVALRTPSPNGGLAGASSEWRDGGRTIVITILPSVSAYQIIPHTLFPLLSNGDATRAPTATPRPASSVIDIAEHAAEGLVLSCSAELRLEGMTAAAFSAAGWRGKSYEAFIELPDGRVIVVGVIDSRDTRIEQRQHDFLAIVNSIRLTDPPAAAR